MQISSVEINGIVVLKLAGKIMGGPEAGQVNDKIHELIATGKQKLIIDMSDLELMNSSGLGIFISAVNTLKNSNGQLVMIHVPDRIIQLFKMTRLISVFNIADDLDQAFDALK
ncbi:MAG TPA: anti-sigma factor antagonist [Caldithrix abyssi]|uniref:Anti-sigma factor antagonist n=1 Tax=Caldithrix abyssi TaxID=187145 RepID=A0A7V5LJD2_CALAY|nr:STAS domain-containing protein [Caldisericaceae bacterium]HHE56018.1 anti-sigma factor antagonist [Caldithrix abyssi]